MAAKETVSFLTEPIFSGSEVNDISIHVKEMGYRDACD